MMKTKIKGRVNGLKSLMAEVDIVDVMFHRLSFRSGLIVDEFEKLLFRTREVAVVYKYRRIKQEGISIQLEFFDARIPLNVKGFRVNELVFTGKIATQQGDGRIVGLELRKDMSPKVCITKRITLSNVSAKNAPINREKKKSKHAA